MDKWIFILLLLMMANAFSKGFRDSKIQKNSRNPAWGGLRAPPYPPAVHTSLRSVTRFAPLDHGSLLFLIASTGVTTISFISIRGHHFLLTF